MKAEYRDGQNPGTGSIFLTQTDGLDSLAAIAIQRASDQKFLTGSENNPWVGEFYYLPVAPIFQPDCIDIPITKEIVDNLDPQEQYALRLQGSDGRIRLKLDAITYSPEGSLGHTAKAGAESGKSAPEPKPAPRPEPDLPPEEPTLPPMDSRPAPARKKWLVPALLAVLAIAALFFWLNQNKTPEDRQPVAENKAPKSESLPKAQPTPQTSLSAEEQVRQFFKAGHMAPKDAVALALKLPAKTRQDQDAVYRLWYFAAENGEPAAYLPYGATLDPSAPVYGTIGKSAPDAWQAYEKAREHEPQKAEAAMNNLRDWLKTEARKGNAQARDWLLKIDQPR